MSIPPFIQAIPEFHSSNFYFRPLMFDPNYPMVFYGPFETEDISTNPCVHHPLLPVVIEKVKDPAYIYRGKVVRETREDDYTLVMDERRILDKVNQEKDLEEKRQEKIRKEKELKALYGGIDVEAYFKKHSTVV